MIDLTGKIFKRLRVLKFAFKRKNKYYWLCECECGKIKPIRSDSLKNGTCISCGCYNDERISKVGLAHKTHGKSHTRLHNIWLDMKKRCTSPTNYAYNNYGGRGISVCLEWVENFENFYNWAINNGYSHKLTLDRIDVNGNYEPLNCRWVTKKKQANNRRTNLFIFHNGETKTLAEWAEYYSINYFTLYGRYKRKGKLVIS